MSTTDMRRTLKIVLEGLQIETRAIRRTFSFTAANSDLQKYLVFVLVITWSVITIGVAYNEASPTATYSMLTALIWALVGRIWGGEVKDMTGGAGND